MTTTIQHNPVLLQKEDEDIALANYLSTSLRFDQVNITRFLLFRALF
jgi:hypothetical protein